MFRQYTPYRIPGSPWVWSVIRNRSHVPWKKPCLTRSRRNRLSPRPRRKPPQLHEAGGCTVQSSSKGPDMCQKPVHKKMDFIGFMDFLDIPGKLFGRISRIVRFSWDRIYYDISDHFPRTLGGYPPCSTDIKKYFHECVNMHSDSLPPSSNEGRHIGLTSRLMMLEDGGTAKKSNTILVCPQIHGFHWFRWYSWKTFRADF